MRVPSTPYELLTSPYTVVREDERIFWMGQEFFLSQHERRVVREQCLAGLERWAGGNSRRTTNTDVV